MRKKVYYLSTCSTCKRIMQELELGSEIEQQDIKTQPMTPEQVDEMKVLAGSYEALFSNRSRQYRARGLHEVTLSEDELRALILEDYTFLKRPVFLIGDQIFIGNAQKTIAAVGAAL